MTVLGRPEYLIEPVSGRNQSLPPAIRRAGKLALLALLVVVGLVVALQSVVTVLVAVGTLILAGGIWWWRRKPEVAVTAISLGFALLLTSEITAWVGQRLSESSYIQIGVVYWTFCGVVVSVTWLDRRQHRSRALTVAMGHGALVVASLFTYLWPTGVPILGLLAALVLVFLRGRMAARDRRERLRQE